jgi:UDP-glucose 4-epimerase
VGNITEKQDIVLVTGGSGFIGSHIVDRLLSCGSNVIIVDDLSTGKKENVNPKAAFYHTDITDEDALKAIFKDHKIDYVIHQAAKINLNVMLENPSSDIKSSVLGTLNLLNLCISYNVKKFIYASSVAVYGRPKKLPVTETDELVPIYSYGIAKKCAEEYVRYYSDYYGLNYSILRYANVYGPRQPIYGEVGVIAIYTERALKGEPLIIYGDGEHLRDYIYIDDVVDITLKLLSVGDREIFNVGCGIGVSTREIFEHFCSAWGETLRHEHRSERVGELGMFYCDISKLFHVIQFLPKTSIKEGINRISSYYRDIH